MPLFQAFDTSHTSPSGCWEGPVAMPRSMVITAAPPEGGRTSARMGSEPRAGSSSGARSPPPLCLPACLPALPSPPLPPTHPG